MPAGSLHIAGRPIDPSHPVLVVAELSGNHGGQLDRAAELVRAAREAGADAVKVQTYKPDSLTIDSDAPPFRVKMAGAWEGRVLYDLYREASTPWAWLEPLKAVADQVGMPFFSSAFDAAAVDFLEDLGVPAYKIASFELVDTELIERAAATGKPVILSTGMATREEIADAISAARRAMPEVELALLKCTSSYPAPPEDLNLRTIVDMAANFDLPTGLSDHTVGIVAPVIAVALGACIVEKHLCLNRADGGPDAHFSLEPHEFEAMVHNIREAEVSLGKVCYGTDAGDESRAYRRSLFVVADVAEGALLTEANVRSIRPADGLAPKELRRVLGRRAARDIPRGTPLSWELVRK
jgi:N-acetylneuraminate synthase